jgi:predicted dehydrogenase
MNPAELLLPVATGSSIAKPRLGFLGLGWIGYQRMVAIADSGWAEISALADPSEECLERAAAYAGAAVPLASFEDLLNAGLDGIVIATPSGQHAAQCAAALERGVAVFCQKPLGRNAEEVRAAVAAARLADRLIRVDLSYRFTHALQKIRALVQSGELGEIFAVDLTFHNAYGPQKPWFYDPVQSGGGCVVDLGIHLVDAALWILPSGVAGVRSRLFHQGRRISGRGKVCEDYATAQLQMESGTVVNLNCSWHLHAGQDAVIEAVFYGTKGGAAMRNQNGSFTEFAADHFTGTSRVRISQPPDDWGGGAARDWARQLSRSRYFDPAIEEIVEVTKVLDAIYDQAAAP